MSYDFSIVHSTARVESRYERPWWLSYHRCFGTCDNPLAVEYILVVHESRAELAKRSYATFVRPFGSTQIVVNDRRDCIVDQSNAGFSKASGKLYCGMSDDVEYPLHWDTKIKELLPDPGELTCLKVSTDGNRPDLLTLPEVCTAALKRAVGGFSPEYISMYADDEYSEQVRRVGKVIQAPHLYFAHRHPNHGTATLDDVYLNQNSSEAYRVGHDAYIRRKLKGFPKTELPIQP